jgi:hypothetical protein
MPLDPEEEHRSEAALITESIPTSPARQGLSDGLEDGPIMATASMLPPADCPLSTFPASDLFETQPPYPQHSFIFDSEPSNITAASFSLHDALTKHLLPGLTSNIPSPTYSQHVFNMAGDVKRRPRNLSRSSTEREPSSEPKITRKSNSIDLVDSKITTTTSPNPRKRPNTEPLDYPRRRATIAVCTHSIHKIH